LDSRNRNFWRVRLSALVIVAFAVPTEPTSAIAQTDNRTTTVMGRERPELNPIGLKISGFILSPSVGVGTTFNDNIFATQNGKKSDVVTTISPKLLITTDWNQHSLRFSGEGTLARYATNSVEDHETVDLKADGRLDVFKDLSVSGALGYQLDSEERGSVDEAGGLTPTEFTIGSLAGEIFNKWNRLSVRAGGQYHVYDFDDVATNTGSINNDDRDRGEYVLDTSIGYEIQSEYEAFIQLIWTLVDYESALDDNGLNRDSEGYEIRVGTRIDLTGLLFGDVFVGYVTRDYDDATLETVDKVIGGVDLTWNITPLTTIKGGFSRLISETTLANASGSISTKLQASVDHELLRNLIVSASSSLSTDDLEGSARADDNFGAGVGAKYLLNRNFSIMLNYDHTKRESNASGADYNSNRVFLRVQGHL
jgi:hypothetical protein